MSKEPKIDCEGRYRGHRGMKNCATLGTIRGRGPRDSVGGAGAKRRRFSYPYVPYTTIKTIKPDRR